MTDILSDAELKSILGGGSAPASPPSAPSGGVLSDQELKDALRGKVIQSTGAAAGGATALGSRMPDGGDWNTYLRGVAGKMGLSITSARRTPAQNQRAGGATGSRHMFGDALDVAGPPEKMKEFAETVAREHGRHLFEVFYDPSNIGVKRGTSIGRIGGHSDHVHVSWAPFEPATPVSKRLMGRGELQARERNLPASSDRVAIKPARQRVSAQATPSLVDFGLEGPGGVGLGTPGRKPEVPLPPQMSVADLRRADETGIRRQKATALHRMDPVSMTGIIPHTPLEQAGRSVTAGAPVLGMLGGGAAAGALGAPTAGGVLGGLAGQQLNRGVSQPDRLRKELRDLQAAGEAPVGPQLAPPGNPNRVRQDRRLAQLRGTLDTYEQFLRERYGEQLKTLQPVVTGSAFRPPSASGMAGRRSLGGAGTQMAETPEAFAMRQQEMAKAYTTVGKQWAWPEFKAFLGSQGVKRLDAFDKEALTAALYARRLKWAREPQEQELANKDTLLLIGSELLGNVGAKAVGLIGSAAAKTALGAKVAGRYAAGTEKVVAAAPGVLKPVARELTAISKDRVHAMLTNALWEGGQAALDREDPQVKDVLLSALHGAAMGRLIDAGFRLTPEALRTAWRAARETKSVQQVEGVLQTVLRPGRVAEGIDLGGVGAEFGQEPARQRILIPRTETPSGIPPNLRPVQRPITPQERTPSGVPPNLRPVEDLEGEGLAEIRAQQEAQKPKALPAPATVGLPPGTRRPTPDEILPGTRVLVVAPSGKAVTEGEIVGRPLRKRGVSERMVVVRDPTTGETQTVRAGNLRVMPTLKGATPEAPSVPTQQPIVPQEQNPSGLPPNLRPRPAPAEAPAPTVPAKPPKARSAPAPLPAPEKGSYHPAPSLDPRTLPVGEHGHPEIRSVEDVHRVAKWFLERGRDLYVRTSGDINADLKLGAKSQYEKAPNTYERGLSTWGVVGRKALEGAGRLRYSPGTQESVALPFSEVREPGDRRRQWLLTGRYRGMGHDGEPIVSQPRIVGVLSSDAADAMFHESQRLLDAHYAPKPAPAEAPSPQLAPAKTNATAPETRLRPETPTRHMSDRGQVFIVKKALGPLYDEGPGGRDDVGAKRGPYPDDPQARRVQIAHELRDLTARYEQAAEMVRHRGLNPGEALEMAEQEIEWRRDELRKPKPKAVSVPEPAPTVTAQPAAPTTPKAEFGKEATYNGRKKITVSYGDRRLDITEEMPKSGKFRVEEVTEPGYTTADMKRTAPKIKIHGSGLTKQEAKALAAEKIGAPLPKPKGELNETQRTVLHAKNALGAEDFRTRPLRDPQGNLIGVEARRREPGSQEIIARSELEDVAGEPIRQWQVEARGVEDHPDVQAVRDLLEGVDYTKPLPKPPKKLTQRVLDFANELERSGLEEIRKTPARLPGKGKGGRSGAILNPVPYGKVLAGRVLKGTVKGAEWVKDFGREFGEDFRPHVDAILRVARQHYEGTGRRDFPEAALRGEAPKPVVAAKPAPAPKVAAPAVPAATVPEKAPPVPVQAKPAAPAPKAPPSPPATAPAPAVKPAAEAKPVPGPEQATGLANQVKEREVAAGVLRRMPEKGLPRSPEALQQRGQELVQGGVDYERVASEIAAGTRGVSADDVAVMLEGRRQLGRKVNAARAQLNDVIEKGGGEKATTTLRAKLEEHEERLARFLDDAAKGSTEWHNIGMALQAGVDLETGIFEDVLERATISKGAELLKEDLAHLKKNGIIEKIGPEHPPEKPEERAQWEKDTLHGQLWRAQTDLAAERAGRKTVGERVRQHTASKRASLDSERGVILGQIRDLLGGSGPPAPKAGMRSGATINPVTAGKAGLLYGKLAMNWVARERLSLDEAVGRTIEELKTHFGVDVTYDDITDEIVELGKRAPSTRDEVQQALFQARADARRYQEIQRQIENLKAGIPNASPRSKQARTGRVAELEDELRELRASAEGRDAMLQQRAQADIEKLKAGTYEPRQPREEGSPELEALRGERSELHLQRQLDAQIKEFRRKLKEGDFAEAASPKEKQYGAETERLRAERNRLAAEVRARIRDLQPVSFGEQVYRFATGTTKALKSSHDLSALGRQGWKLAVANPDLAAKAFGRQLQAFSPAKAEAIRGRLEAHPMYPMAKESGLYLAGKEGGTGLTKGEEAFGGGAYRKWRAFNPVAVSERLYETFLDSIRMDAFARMTRSAGKTDARTLKAISHYVNTATGRGWTGELGFEKALAKAADGLGIFVYGPRWVASNFEYAALRPLWTGNVASRVAISKQYARTIGGIGTALWLAKMGGELAGWKDKDGKPLVQVPLDMGATDFGKLKVGNTRIDMGGGLLQNLVFAERMAPGGHYTNSKGEKHDIGVGAKFGEANVGDVLQRFYRSKASPLLGTAWNLREGKDYVGNPYSWKHVPADLFAPISLHQMAQGAKQDGWNRDDWLGMLDLLGFSTNTYQPGQKKKERPF